MVSERNSPASKAPVCASAGADSPHVAEIGEGEGDSRKHSRPVHGGIRPGQLRELGLDAGQALDFSASVSPLGPPEGLWERLRSVDLTAYPDPECLELKETLARQHGVSEDRALVGNGSTELIHLLARAFISPPAGWERPSVLQLSPTYGEYAGACSLAGAEVLEVSADRNRGFAWDLTAVKDVVLARQPSLVFLCNPNNPTGVYLEKDSVASLLEAVDQAGGLLVLDEAYVNFVERSWDACSLLDDVGGNSLVVLRSMTKDYALTGLRLGYSLAGSDITSSLARLQPDWSVNSLAQAAGLLALSDAGYLPAARQAVSDAKAYLTAELNALGFRVLPSTANFMLVEVGDAAVLAGRLMRRGIFVRDCASFGLPDCVRLGIRAMPDCRRLVAEVASIVRHQ